MNRSRLARVQTGALALALAFGCGWLAAPSAKAAPTAEVAKKCLSYAYRLYPYKRPGAAKASNGRQLYFNDCIAKNGDVTEPPKPNRQVTTDGKN